MIVTMSYSELRQKLKSALDSVCDTRMPIRVTRRNGERVVLLPESEYEALEETAYLLRSPANARKLLRSLNAGKKDFVVFKDLKELKREIGL